MKIHLSKISGSMITTAALAISSLSFFAACTPIEPGPVEDRRSDISVRDQDYLANYGDWIQEAPYGEVWTPRVNSSWEPFYYGQWVWSDQGWMWESYEPYGWLVYHHGNWEYRPDTGWFWVPSEVWSPATVQWTEFGDYVAWAPSPPGGVILPTPWEPDGARVWKVVESRDFAQDNVGKYKVVRNIPGISVGADITRGQQPDVKVIEKVTKRTLTAIQVQRRPTVMGSHTYYKTVLPAPDSKRIKTETTVVEKTVLVKKVTAPSTKPAEKTESAKESKKAKKEKKADTDKQETDTKQSGDQTPANKPTR